MNCLLVCKYGQVCDRLQYMLDEIYCNNHNTYTRVDNAFDAKNMIRDNDLIIVDYALDGNETGLDFITSLKDKLSSSRNTRVIFMCMPEMYNDMMNTLIDGYEYWFWIIEKGIDINKLRKILGK